MVSCRNGLPDFPIANRRRRDADGARYSIGAIQGVYDLGYRHSTEECPHFEGASTPKSCAAPKMGLRYPLGMSKHARATDIKADVGRRLKAAREVVYDSAAACAREFEIPKNTWGNYEAGERYPDPVHLVRFCDATGFTTDFIYRGRFKGIAEDVQLRLAVERPDLVDEAPDVGRSSKAAVLA